jgi:hypothetical protein
VLRENGDNNAGPNKATVTEEQDSDANIDAESRKLDRAVSLICKGC